MEFDNDDLHQHSDSAHHHSGVDSAELDQQGKVESYANLGFDGEDDHQSSSACAHSHPSMDPNMEYDNEDLYPDLGSAHYRSQFYHQDEIDSYYHHHINTSTFDNLSFSDDEEQSPTGSNMYVMDSVQDQHYAYGSSMDSDGAHPRFVQTQSSEEEDMKEPKVKLVDPGMFLYNKRVFITALPCLLLLLLMTGEMLLLIVTVGGLVIGLMVQTAADVSKRCVVVFALLFIPCHILVVGTVLPLLWLSMWNLLLIVIVNVFCVLTGAWIIIQFVAFRMEEPAMCATIERMLFSVYPCLCSALVTWVLSTVMSVSAIPFIFLCIWFVCLQLYLMPAASSFKVPGREEEDMDILQQSAILAVVAGFVISGPGLHVVLHVAGTSSLALWSVPSLAVLGMLLSVGLFLSTLLSVRQLCEHLGRPHLLIVQVRWVSGLGVVVLCYPVLQQLGMMSHFLLALPVTVVGFVALGLTLHLKKSKMLSLLLMAVLVLLLCLWLSHLPWTLIYHFMKVISLKSFYAVVTVNFVLCVLAIPASWGSSGSLLGCLLLLQAVGLTVCEMGLYQAGLYSLPALQLTGLLCAYTLHRLYLASKLTCTMATLISAVQLTKSAVGTLGYLVRQGDVGQMDSITEVTVLDFLTLLSFVGTLVWFFLYETTEQVTVSQAVKHVTVLLLSLGISSPSFLVPVSGFLLHDDLSLADLVGLWYLLGGVLVLLYCLQHRQSAGVAEQLMKVALVLAGVGALVMLMQPQFLFTLYAVYQWCEVFSVLMIAALLATDVEVGFPQILITTICLGICPGIHATLLVYDEELATVVHFILLSAISCLLLTFLFILVKLQTVSEAVHSFIKLGTVVIAVLTVGVLTVDLINFEYIDSVWDYPAWTVALGASAGISLALKALTLKLGPHQLPLTQTENGGQSVVPVMANMATVLAFLLVCTQGPLDTLLHDLWCCAASIVLILLQRDPILLTSLSANNRATPTILAAVATLVVSTLLQSQLWQFESGGGVALGLAEVLVVFTSLPVYLVLAGILWRGEIWSEKAVVFTMPLNALLFLLGSSYTGWVLAVAGFVCGLSMMMFKLPLLPYNLELLQR